MKIAIVGAGLTGLTAGLRLSQKGHEVTIFEASETIGGLASAFTAGSESLDRFYRHIFVSDTELLSLISELSSDHLLEWFEPKNAIYLEDSLHPFTTPLDLLRFKPLSLISRFRMGFTVVLSRFIKDYKPFESITARDWIVKRSGKDTYEKVWGPLLRSKFDVDSDNISGTWIWNKFKLRGSSRGKNINKEQLGYMKGGFITLMNSISEAIVKNGGSIRLKNRVLEIKKSGDSLMKRWEVRTQKDSSDFDNVLFTGAPYLLAEKCRELPQAYTESLKAIRYKANICLTLELSQSLSPYYWITISQEGPPFVLVIEHTNLVGKRDYGSHIVYLSRYLDESNPLFTAPDEEVIETFIQGLTAIFPDFRASSIRKATLSRARNAQPVVTQGYAEKIPYIKTPLAGLHLASMSQIYPEDRGMNYAVRLGSQAALKIMENLK